MNKVSMWGIVAAFVYFCVAGYLYWNAINCHGMFCDVGLGLVVAPWSYFLGTDIVWFWAAAVINILILYFVFAVLQSWVQK